MKNFPVSFKKSRSENVMDPSKKIGIISEETQYKIEAMVQLIKQSENETKILFSGQSRNARLISAEYIAFSMSRSLFNVNLSELFRRKIEDTKKSLNILFKRAKKKNLVLFFDEVEILFRKKFEDDDLNERFMQDEIIYLLYKIRNHPGIIIFNSVFPNRLMKRFTKIINHKILINESHPKWETKRISLP